MASSSSSHLKNTSNFVEQEKEHLHSQRHGQKKEKEKEKEEENWLKLGLGLGRRSDIINNHHHHGSRNNPQFLLCSSDPSPSSSSHIGGSHGDEHHHDHQEMVKLGLGLGFQQDSRLEPKDNKMMMVESTIGYGNSLLLGSPKDHYSDDDDDGNGMVKLWVPSSWKIDSSMVVDPCGGGGDTHYYKCGLWFTLRPSTNRGGEALPQIPKAYIRVRDENMTVFMVKKYLVRKLGLSNEAEVDISCMGESLSHIQTLKQVRDAVWIPRLLESLDSTTFSLGVSNHNNYYDYDDASLHYIMCLLYRKHCFLN
ncbi:hypothetical protein PIB30_025056 [Stylosanthes scabra]|uniref:Uncharacterized protein n=1 Tax=Stylosanthes scabra TaxID=79078 RepID=A0ABU6T9N6_9FABA|nr:hypothetical protein [Stylosanthes scabra]